MSEQVQRADDDEEGATLSRSFFGACLGPVGFALFDLLDNRDKRGERVPIHTVRAAREQFSLARQPGRWKVVRDGRGASAEEEGMLLISISDLREALEASKPAFDWAEAFAPRADLPAASDTLEIRSGGRGERIAL